MLGEAAAIGGGGALLGLAVHAALGTAIARLLQVRTGVLLELPGWDWALLWAPAAMLAFCLLAGLWPAWRACTTPVAENLNPLS